MLIICAFIILHVRYNFSLPHAVLFNPDSHFSVEAIFKLEYVGITLLIDLEQYVESLQSVVGIDLDGSSEFSISSFLIQWLQGRTGLHPTWRHFFWALREIGLSHLADKMETYLKGEAVQQGNLNSHPVTEEGVDKKKEGKI